MEVGAFFQIATPAGERKIVQAYWSAVLPGDNVFDVESAAECGLREAAVLAAVAGALPHRLGRPANAGCCNF